MYYLKTYIYYYSAADFVSHTQTIVPFHNTADCIVCRLHFLLQIFFMSVCKHSKICYFSYLASYGYCQLLWLVC